MFTCTKSELLWLLCGVFTWGLASGITTGQVTHNVLKYHTSTRFDRLGLGLVLIFLWPIVAVLALAEWLNQGSPPQKP